LVVLAAGCSSQTSKRDEGKAGARPVAVQLNWYAEAEHGGAYQAAADGTYAAAGFDVEIRPGGRATPVAAEVALGRADFAITNADDVVLFRAEGADIVAVLAAMQDHPRCILVREDSGVQSFDDLKGMTLQRQEGRGFVEFLRLAGKLDGVREVPYHGNVSGLVGDPQIAIQAYSFAEPYLARGEGVEVKTLMVSDLGWNPYSSVLVTRGELIREQPELVRDFVAATRLGWQNYITDPAAGNAAILAANQHGMTQEALEFGSKELVALAMPEPLTVADVGVMSAQRWQTLVKQMEDVKLIKAGGVKPEDCFTLEFLAAEPKSDTPTEGDDEL
jgi:NitT/TauT family transport system substrate-binding protein